MSAPTPRRTCPHHRQGPQAGCQSCAVMLRLPTDGRVLPQEPRSEAERLRQYLQDPEVIAQMLRDQQALLAQRCAPSAGWGPDRSIANGFIGGSDPSKLPSSYPYPRTLTLDTTPGGAPKSQNGAAPAPPRAAYYHHQYMSQQPHQHSDHRGRTPSSNGNYTYRPPLQSITGRSSYNSRNSGSVSHGGNNDENEDEDSDEDDDNQS